MPRDSYLSSVFQGASSNFRVDVYFTVKKARFFTLFFDLIE